MKYAFTGTATPPDGYAERAEHLRKIAPLRRVAHTLTAEEGRYWAYSVLDLLVVNKQTPYPRTMAALLRP